MAIPETLPEITSELVAIRKKPTTEERFKSYPALLQRFTELVAVCDDAGTLRTVITLDDGYYLLAGYRQRVLERWLSLERTPEVLRQYALQLMLFGDVDEFGNEDLDVDDRVNALNDEAEQLENQ